VVAAGVAGILCLLLLVTWLTAGSGFAQLGYLNFPGHPYPPTGFYRNPFSTNQGDLINAAEAARVKADWQADGQQSLNALATGDDSMLDRSITGTFLSDFRDRIRQNNRDGVAEREQNQPVTDLVGRLTDPPENKLAWCVEEKASGASDLIDKATGQVLGHRTYRYDTKFWLVRIDGRYLITNAHISVT
jgi:uncharacterized protein RhaS with RHS repeats